MGHGGLLRNAATKKQATMGEKGEKPALNQLLFG